MNNPEREVPLEKRAQTSNNFPSGNATPRWLLAVADELDGLSLCIKRYGRQDACHCATRLRNLADIVEQRQ